MRLVGELHPMHKLSEKQVLQIRDLWKIGHRNLRVLARNYGVSSTNIRKIVMKQTWVHIIPNHFKKYE
jgi:hypothetical protein